MKFINDWMILCLGLGLVCGGAALGRQLGAATSAWLLGLLFLAFRFADTLWREVVAEMRTADPKLDFIFWVPTSYGLLFAGFLLPFLLWLLYARKSVRALSLPGAFTEILGPVCGLSAGFVLLCAVVQSQLLQPDVERRLPETTRIARSVLTDLGQKHVAPTRPPGRPAAQPPR